MLGIRNNLVGTNLRPPDPNLGNTLPLNLSGHTPPAATLPYVNAGGCHIDVSYMGFWYTAVKIILHCLKLTLAWRHERLCEAARCIVCTVFCRLNTTIVSSKPAQSIGVICDFPVTVSFSLGTSFVRNQISVQRHLPNVHTRLKNPSNYRTCAALPVRAHTYIPTS